MNGDNLPANPYESPTLRDATSRETRWRIGPTLFFAVFGILMLASGVAMVVFYLRMLLTGSDEVRSDILDDNKRQFVVAAMTILTLVCGSSWLFGARAFWTRRRRLAMLSVAVGVLAIACVFSLISASR